MDELLVPKPLPKFCSDGGEVLEKYSSLPESAPVLYADQKISPLSC
jgi:hypothetical protein